MGSWNVFFESNMNKLRQSLLILGLMTISVSAMSQSFPGDRDKFVKELQRLVANSATADDVNFLKKQLTPMLLETKDFPDNYFSKMVETANLMETKKIKYYPEIYQYVYSVYSFVKTKQSASSYQAWHSSVDKMLDAKNINKFKDFIEFSAGFFSENILTESSNFKWKYQGGTYSFEYTDKPLIKFEGGRLSCVVDNRARNKEENKKIDSIVIYNSKGVFYPVGKDWTGKGGTIDWQKVGLPKDNTFAVLNSYEVNMKMPNLRVDTVLLTTPYFTKPIYGQLIERAFNINREEDKTFPQFTSFERKLAIKGITQDIDYIGGFSLKGPNFIGVGSANDPAKLLIAKEGKTFIRISSQVIIVSPKKIMAESAQLAILMAGKDSISHPGLEFSYDIDKKLFEFTRGKTGIAQAPFASTYHALDIYVPKITWIKNAPNLDLTYGIEIGQELRIAKLESKNFYDSRLYDQLQGLETVHPLVSLSNYCYKYDEYTITEGKFATALGKTVDQSKSMLLQLSGLGFVSYNPDTKMVIVNDKTMNFIAAKSGKKDFDNLSFISDLRVKTMPADYTPEQISKNKQLQVMDSTIKVKNNERKLMKLFGTVNLSTLGIDLLAVDRVLISEPQSTAVFPEGSKVSINKDRNFDFKGWINAGKLEIKSLSANYVYATNKINLIKTDKGIFRVRPFSEKDGTQNISMQSALSNVVGEILVDAVNNRSGNNKAITDFPKLIVSNESKVYYNDYSIYRGAYDSTRFYFTVAPFQKDSLDNFKEKNLKLKGELVSAGIFPKFQEELKIMPDYSFGFAKVVPAGGYDFYSTKAKYDNKIVLSRNGLQGQGKIDFIQSTSESKAFTFLPDSTIGYAKFTNKPIETGVQFPDVISDNAYITYVPKRNILKASSTETLLSFFKGEAKLNGTAVVTDAGMRGFGILNLKEANVQAKNFKFQRWDADSDTAVFNLKNKYQKDGEDPLSFKTDNVNAHITFKERKGVFKSNRGESKVEFPVNQYYCKMDLFTWNMDQESVEMAQADKKNINIDAGLDLAKSNFFSTHPRQDSLQFKAPVANFSLKDNTIFCSKVEYIDVADARISPDSMKVVIRPKAKLDELKNATIVANYITKYHKFIKANTLITARKAYTSEGDYPYIDADSVRTIVHMDKIGLDSSFQTVATGKIADTENFKLSKQFDYYGTVKIHAANPLITFSGATRINHNCDKFPRNWMAFSSQVDPKNIQIPVSSAMKTLEGIPVSAGIVWRDSRITDSVRLYPTFLSTLENPKDPILITASGLLQYNFAAKEFQIGSAEKLVNRNEKGNFIALHTESCSLNGDGKIDLGMDYGDVTVDAVGVANYNQSTGLTTLNITARYNIPVLDKGLFEKMGAKIAANEGLKPLDLSSSTLIQAVTEWKDLKTAESIKSDFIQKGEVKKIPRELEQGIVITGIRLSSYNNANNQINGLITSTEYASIVNVFDKSVFKQVPAKAFFKQVYSENASGDKFNLLINVPGGSDYFFDYGMTKKEGLLQVYTSDSDLQNGITALKEDKRKSKNFKYDISLNTGLLSIFTRLFE